MASALTRPEDLLAAYAPGTVTLGDQSRLLEISTGGPPGAFPERGGDADTYYEDFTSGLRDYVAARMSTNATELGGPTLVGGWFGGAGADPSAIVMGIDWLTVGGADETFKFETLFYDAVATPSAPRTLKDYFASSAIEPPPEHPTNAPRRRPTTPPAEQAGKNNPSNSFTPAQRQDIVDAPFQLKNYFMPADHHPFRAPPPP